jgi:hypothetical protein
MKVEHKKLNVFSGELSEKNLNRLLKLKTETIISPDTSIILMQPYANTDGTPDSNTEFYLEFNNPTVSKHLTIVEGTENAIEYITAANGIIGQVHTKAHREC